MQVTREAFACVFVTAPSPKIMRDILSAMCPPLEDSTGGRIRERFGAAQAFCRVPRAPVGWTGSPPLRVRLCAVAAYDLGAISVEYFHEDMQRSGRSPYRFARPSRR